MNGPTISSLDAGFWETIENYLVTSTHDIRNEWLRQEQSIKASLETIRREREAAEANIRAIEERTTETFDYFLSNLPEQRFRPLWEAQGELMPPSIRGLLDELRGACQSQPSHALFPAGNSTHQQSSGPSLAGDAVEREVTVSVHASQTSRKDSSPTKRSAEAIDGSSDSTVNKRQRVSNSDYAFRASEETTLPQPQSFRGTVMLYEIDGLHWAFRSPVTGPGYYVLLCNETDKDFHSFQADPWVHQRALKHYTKEHDCHDYYFDRNLGVVTEPMIMQRFGYLVEDMTEESFRGSNQRIDIDRQAKKQKSKNHYKTPSTHPTPNKHLGGSAAVADMGPYANGNASHMEDFIPNNKPRREVHDLMSQVTTDERRRRENAPSPVSVVEDCIVVASAANPNASRRPVSVTDVHGKHWTFRYGGQYHVLLCDGDVDTAHRFQYNPLEDSRGFRHLNAPTPRCHKGRGRWECQHPRDKEYKEMDMIDNFGHIVEDMTDEEATASNNTIEGNKAADSRI
ncbi:hypothetical protein CONLIGDRAFT_685516 [Coniochaeta ligniaria NRRL 30616]|uniref:Uncharacterized protein n=1 Tax=Coniochaeta ligniaria NRRL 30616 TaxID=1408157 RepID=A0A1J7J5X2_9PEZI|nr:hypothetical protein CONLIGDRAFT_685516 [Coniochaeta ligniaria NRRL 30616]